MKKLLCLMVVMLLAVNASAVIWSGTSTVGGNVTAGTDSWFDTDSWLTTDAYWGSSFVGAGAIPSSSDGGLDLYPLVLGATDGVHSISAGPATVDAGFDPGPANINAAGASAVHLYVGFSGYTGELNVGSAGTLATTGQLQMGYGTKGAVVNNAGTVTVGDLMYMGAAGGDDIHLINSGTFNTASDIIIAGGIDAANTITNTGTLSVGGNIDLTAGVLSHIQLDDGTIEAGGLLIDAYYYDTIDITEGVLILDGDWTVGYIDPENGTQGWGLPLWTTELIFNEDTPEEFTYQTITAYGGTGTIMYDYNNINPGQTTIWAEIPEPATMSLLGLGAAALLRRRKK